MTIKTQKHFMSSSEKESNIFLTIYCSENNEASGLQKNKGKTILRHTL